MFKELKEINSRPAPFEFYTADELWTNEHTSKQMLAYHLNEAIDVSSRNRNFIESSVEWVVSHFGVDEYTEIADFGCGPGLYTGLLAKTGATGLMIGRGAIRDPLIFERLRDNAAQRQPDTGETRLPGEPAAPSRRSRRRRRSGSHR